MRAILLFIFASFLLINETKGASGPEIIARAGNWSAYKALTDEGHLLCGVAQVNPPYSFFLKAKLGQDLIFLHISKTSWYVPKDIEMKVVILIDGRVSLKASFIGTSDPEMIETDLDIYTALSFIRDFAHGSQLVISFVSGDEDDWRGSLSGTLKVSEAFAHCIEDAQAAPEPTQPFDSSHPPPTGTQPFRSQPRSSSPKAGQSL